MTKLIIQFKKELLFRGYSDRKAEKYCSHLGLFFIWCHGSLDMFNENMFREFLVIMKNK